LTRHYGRLRSQGFFGGFFGQESFGAFLGTFFRVTKRLPTAVLTLGVFWSVIKYILTALKNDKKTDEKTSDKMLLRSHGANRPRIFDEKTPDEKTREKTLVNGASHSHVQSQLSPWTVITD